MRQMLTPSAIIEALLYASGEPLEKARLAKLMEIKLDRLEELLGDLDTELAKRGLVLLTTETEVELRTSPEAADFVKKLRESELSRDLGKAGLETLAAVAYSEGTTRGEIDWVRGVNSSTSLRSLLIRGLVESEEDPRDKRRLRYRITPEALAHLGVKKASDLPRHSELSGAAAAVVEAEQAAALTATEVADAS